MQEASQKLKGISEELQKLKELLDSNEGVVKAAEELNSKLQNSFTSCRIHFTSKVLEAKRLTSSAGQEALAKLEDIQEELERRHIYYVKKKTILYCIILYYIILYYIILYYIILYYILLYCIVLYCIVLYCVVLCCVVLCCVVLCCVVLCCVTLCYVMLCYVI